MSTSKLQRAVGNLLDKTFPQFTIRENYRPDWLMSPNLTKLELDFYIEDLRIAFEIQGAQHYEYVEFFHRTRDGFEKRKLYDEEKRNLCYGAKVQLVEIFNLLDAEIAVKEIHEKHTQPQVPEYSRSDRLLDTRKEIIGKYQADYVSLLENGETVCQRSQITGEISRFLQCVIRYRKLHKTNNIPYHKFKYIKAAQLKEIITCISNPASNQYQEITGLLELREILEKI